MGPLADLLPRAQSDPNHKNFMVAGPWITANGAPSAEYIGQVPFGGHETAREFRENIEAPFFRYYLHGKGEASLEGQHLPIRIEHLAHLRAWPPKAAKPQNLYLHSDGTLSFDAPPAGAANDFAQYVSDPANPVPYRRRPISPTYPGGDWRTWEAADQRFVDHRPDVLSSSARPWITISP